MFNMLAKKLTGKGIEECVLRFHANRNKLYEIIDKIKVREAQLNSTANKDKDQVLQKLQQELNDVRVQYAVAEATLEKVKAEQSGLISLVGLLTASIQAGKLKETTEIEAAIAKIIDPESLGLPKEKEEAQEGKIDNDMPQSSLHGTETQGDEMESKVFTVLEVRNGKSEGTIRAYCEARDGSKHAVFAKNGNGKKLVDSVGKSVSVKYRQGDKGLIAFAVDVLNF